MPSSGAFRQAPLVRAGLIAGRPAAAFAGNVIKSFDVRTTGPAAEARSCRAAICRSSSSDARSCRAPDVLVVSQPTWGVDAGAAAAIHQALIDLADNGAAVLVISQDLDEIFSICGPHRGDHRGQAVARAPDRGGVRSSRSAC